jgi:chromosome segregation ATPase
MTGWTDAVVMQRQLEAAEATAAEWQAAAEAHRVEAQVQRDRADAATRKAESWERGHDHAWGLKVTAEAEVTRLSEALAAAEEDAKQAHVDTKATVGRWKAAEARVHVLEAHASDLRTRIAELEAVLDRESQSRLEACEEQAQNKRAESRVRELDSEAPDLRSRIAELDAALDAAARSKLEVETRVRELEALLHALVIETIGLKEWSRRGLEKL